MAFPVRYRLLGQLSLSFKINGLLTEPVLDLWTSFLPRENFQPNLRQHRPNSDRITVQERHATLKPKSTVVHKISGGAASSAVASQDLGSVEESGLHQANDIILTPHDDKPIPSSKLTQLSNEVEFEVEALFFKLQERISKVNLEVARLRIENRAFRKELCLMNIDEGPSGFDAPSLLRENRSLRMRIVDLELSTKRLHLNAIFEDTDCLPWKDHPKVRQHVAEYVCIAQKEFKDPRLERTIPLAEIGSAVRNRWLEHSMPSRKSVIAIIRGNEAAHSGAALADSILYHPNHKNNRKDVALYIERYGLSPLRVYQLRECQDLMTLLDWYGSVKSWRGPTKFARTPFVKAWPLDFFEKYGRCDAAVVRAAFADGKQTHLLSRLRPFFLKEDVINKKKQERKRGA